MKIKVIKIREAAFVEYEHITSQFQESIIYKVYIDEVYSKSFFDKESMENYIQYIKEMKNNYEKVIKEIEI